MRTAGQGPGGFEKRDGFMRPGQDLVMAGHAGFAGTVKIGSEKRDVLNGRFSPVFLRCLDETEPYSVEQWIKREQKEEPCSFTAYEYAGEGGVLAALWNLSGIFNAGIDVDLRSMPMRQITVEICELFELNPYRLYSGNCAILASDRGGQLVRRLMAEGIPAGVIASVEDGNARQIRHGQEGAGFLERPQPDELTKII